MPTRAIFTISALAALLAGCNQAPPPAPDMRAADVKTIHDLEMQQGKDWAAKDVDKLTAFYADNATIMAPGFPPATGTAAIKGLLGEVVKDPNWSLTFESSSSEAAKSGDVAYTRGTYTETATDPKSKKVMMEKGTYLTVFAKQADGSWKAVEDINTPSGPSMPAGK